MSFVGDIIGDITGANKAADASRDASELSAGFQREALDYLKTSQAPLLEAQQFGLSGLMDYFGGNQQGLIDQVQSSPFYSSMIDQGEEAVLRNQAATGGLRSGTAKNALAQNSQNVLQGLVNQQLGGLGQLAGYQPNTAGVAQATSNIGNTLAQGITAGAQAQQAGMGQFLGLGGSVLQGMAAGGTGLFSDERLKDNIKLIGKVNGHNWYSWTWNKVAEGLGLKGESQGVLAQEVEQTKPELIGERDGYKTVNYAGIV